MTELPKSKETLNIDVTVAKETVEDDLFKIYSQILRGIKKEDVVFSELKGGFVNLIYRAYLKHDPKKSVIFRTYGFKLNANAFKKGSDDMKSKVNQTSNETEKIVTTQTENPTPDFDINTAFFNRATEFEVMNEISKHGLCEPVYAKYNNGICYGYSHGVTCDGPLMLTNDFLNEMAPKLARFHSIKFEVPGIKFKTHYERMLSQIGAMVEQLVGNLDQKMQAVGEFPYNVFPSMSKLAEEDKKLNELLKEIGMGDITFCHNDPNQKNIVWDPQNRTLSFIDLEMAMNNYSVMEIGQLFSCYPGPLLEDFNVDLFPSEDYRKRFLRLYLEERNKLNNIKKTEKEFEDDLQKIFVQTNLTSLTAMLRLINMTASFDFQPDFFNNPDLEKRRKGDKYYCGKFGYIIYQFYVSLKDDFVKSAERYLEASKLKK